MNILMVAPQPFFTPRGTPFSVYYRIRVACELGHKVELLTYGQGNRVEVPGCRVIRIPAFRWLGPVGVGPSLRKLFLDFFMVAWTVGLLVRHRYDVVHAHEEAIFWCRWLKPLFRFRLVYDMHSSLPQQLNNFRFTRSRALHWLFEVLERSSLREADAVITICPALSRHAKGIADNDKVVLIENSLYDAVKFAGSDVDGPDRLSEADRLAAADQWLRSRHPEKVIAYAGTLEVYQGIDMLLEAFSLVGRQMPDASLLIVGGSPREVEQLRGYAQQLELGEAVHFTGQLPQPEAQRLVIHAGVAVSPRISGNNAPMKIYQLMADGIAIVATRIESHTQILHDDIAILSDLSTGELAEAISRALSDREGARAMGRRAQQWYREQYSRTVYTTKMLKLLSLVT
jgi:glycosyltransferase involved in cell wall biosynthesis